MLTTRRQYFSNLFNPLKTLSAVTVFAVLVVTQWSCTPSSGGELQQLETQLMLQQDEETGAISVFREGEDEPILTQNAAEDHRPFLHPIVSPDGESVLTEYSPGHHPHQTGLFWGFTRVNGRDYFHNPQADYWRRESTEIIIESGALVKWKTVYNLLDETGETVMSESQVWEMSEEDDQYILDLVWRGTAAVPRQTRSSIY